jgi:hypothetical protein
LPDAATLPQEAIMAMSATTRPTEEQPMFPTAHPDIMVQLANARIDELRAVAERSRRARPILAGWRKARFVEPVADLSRVSPAAVPEADRAA